MTAPKDTPKSSRSIDVVALKPTRMIAVGILHHALEDRRPGSPAG